MIFRKQPSQREEKQMFNKQSGGTRNIFNKQPVLKTTLIY